MGILHVALFSTFLKELFCDYFLALAVNSCKYPGMPSKEDIKNWVEVKNMSEQTARLD